MLRKDCIARDKLPAFDSLGDQVLRILYDNGVDPSVQAIVAAGLNGNAKTPQTKAPPTASGPNTFD